jgi:hypothetical protein
VDQKLGTRNFSAFLNCYYLIRIHTWEFVYYTAGPVDFQVGFFGLAQAEVDAQVALGNIG